MRPIWSFLKCETKGEYHAHWHGTMVQVESQLPFPVEELSKECACLIVKIKSEAEWAMGSFKIKITAEGFSIVSASKLLSVSSR